VASLHVLLVDDSVLLAEKFGDLIRRLPHVDLFGTADTEAEAILESVITKQTGRL
jgi:hypothetical protein